MSKLRPVIRKVDANHGEIVNALRRLGYTAKSTATLGQGFPDVVFARCGRTFLAEIKDGSLSPSRRRLTYDEARFHGEWAGKIELFESVDDVLAFDCRERAGEGARG